MPVPYVIQPGRHLVLVDPVPRQRYPPRVSMCDVVEFGKLAPVRLGFTLTIVGSKSMIELVDHLCLVQGQYDLSVLLESVHVQLPPSGGQLGPHTKQPRVVGHVKHAQESQAPWIPVRVSLPPQHARSAVHRQVYCCIALRPERGTVPRVRVERSEIGGSEREVPLPVVEIDCASRIEGEVGLAGLPDRQQHEPIPVIETLEDEALVFEVMDTGKGATVEKCLKILLRGVVGDNPARHDEACATARRQYAPIVLGEQRVRVHVALSTERVAPGLSNEMALSLRETRCTGPLVPENRIRGWKRSDEFLSLGSVPRRRD